MSESISMSENISIKNLTTFPVGFRRINGNGEVNLPPKTSILIDRAEVISQVQSQSKLFCGEDYDSAHPYIYIDDKTTRVYVGFDTETESQPVIDEEKIKAVFAIKSQKAFEKAVRELAITFSEKKVLIEAVRKLGINDYNKIRFVESYTGMNVDND